jgi:Arc/MetJ-type ribon-helix-helix transcriptional regulator
MTLRESKLKALREAIAEGLASGPSEPLDMAEIAVAARREMREAKTSSSAVVRDKPGKDGAGQ